MKPIVFLGNCQARSLANIIRRDHTLEQPVQNVWLNCTELHDPTEVFNGIEKHIADPFKQIWLRAQFEIISLLNSGVQPAALIFNVFHEGRPLKKHKSSGTIFHLEYEELKNEEIAKWLESECIDFVPDAKTYLTRYLALIKEIRSRLGNPPCLIVKRVSPFPEYGPNPHSELRNWTLEYCQTWYSVEELGDISVLELDDVIAELHQNFGTPVQKIFPYLRYSENAIFGRVEPYSSWPLPKSYYLCRIGRDVEHLSNITLERAALHVATWLDTGKIPIQNLRSQVQIRPWEETVKPIDLSAVSRGDIEDLYFWTNIFEQLLLALPTNNASLISKMGSMLRIDDEWLLVTIRLFADLSPSAEINQFLKDHCNKAGVYHRRLNTAIGSISSALEK